MLIYKIFRPSEWAVLESKGESDGAPIDVSDGYIHFSTAAQAVETAQKHFADAGDLILAAVEAEACGDALKWEVSRGGAKFPHLYRPLRLTDICWTTALPQVDGAHVFPKEMI